MTIRNLALLVSQFLNSYEIEQLNIYICGMSDAKQRSH